MLAARNTTRLFQPALTVSPPAASNATMAPVPSHLHVSVASSAPPTPLQSDVPLRPPPLRSVCPPVAASSPPAWSSVSLFLAGLSEELVRELLHFAGRDWRLACFDMRLLRDRLDVLVIAANSYAESGSQSNWDTVQESAHAVLASLVGAISTVEQFVHSKEAECCEALRQLTSNQHWRSAKQLDPPSHTFVPLYHSAADSSSSSSSAVCALPSSSASLHSSAEPVSRFSPSMCLSFGSVILEVHPRDAHHLLPASLYLMLAVNMLRSDNSRQSNTSTAEHSLCRGLLSISRCLDHLLRYHLLHHLVLFHLLIAFQCAIAPAGPLPASLASAYHSVAVSSMANTHSLLSLATHLTGTMQTLQVGHIGLAAHQQRRHTLLRCGGCHELVAMPPVHLQCGHVSCYVCTLWRVRTTGAECMQCGAHNSMAQLRIDTLQSALTLMDTRHQQPQLPQQQQEPAPKVKLETPLPNLSPHTPLSPPQPRHSLPKASTHIAVEHPGAELPLAGSLALGARVVYGYEHHQSVATVKTEMSDEESFNRLSGTSLSSSSPSSFITAASTTTCSSTSLSPSPSISPLSPIRPIFGAIRRSSVPAMASGSGRNSPPSPSTAIAALTDARHSLPHTRSRSARILSEVCLVSGAAATTAVGAGLTRATIIASRIPSLGSAPLPAPFSRSSPLPLMATVVEVPRNLSTPSVECQPIFSGVSSCHQCKCAKPRSSLMACSSPAERTAYRQRKCRKKYCNGCVSTYRWTFVLGATQWCCPACEGLCLCAACQRSRQERKLREESEASMDWTSNVSLFE